MVSAVRKVWSTAVTGCFRLSHTHSHTQQLHSLCLCVCVCFWSASSTVPQRLAFPRTKPLVKIQTFHYTVLEIQYSITVKPPFETELSLKHTHIRPGLFWSVLPSCWLCVCARGFDVFWLEAFAVCVCVCPRYLEPHWIRTCQHGSQLSWGPQSDDFITCGSFGKVCVSVYVCVPAYVFLLSVCVRYSWI